LDESVHHKSYEHTPQLIYLGEFDMVYCTKCGARNTDDARICSNCGAALYTQEETSDYQTPYYYRRHRYYAREHRHRGFPLGALLAGAIIIIIGMAFLIEQTYNVDVVWWPFIIVVVGIGFLIRSVLWHRR
jgi:predicted amidophosphoribosyltransferase